MVEGTNFSFTDAYFLLKGRELIMEQPFKKNFLSVYLFSW